MPLASLRRSFAGVVRPRAAVVVALAGLASVSSLPACGQPTSAQQAPVTGKKRPPPTGPTPTKVLAFAIDLENLNVDKIAMRDGTIRPDGNRDHVFTATVEGPADALYIVTVSEKGSPHYGFRADTIVGHEEIPTELGSVVDIGRLTVWMAVVENGKFINDDNGTLGVLPEGIHALKIYVPNTGNLSAGSYLRLYARSTNGALVPGPVVRY